MILNDRKLQDKIVLITGGNSGIGLATAKLMHLHGAKLVIVGRNPATLEQARTELGEETLAIAADISAVHEIENVLLQVHDAFGRIDVLFANAGTSQCPPILHTDEQDFDSIMNINVKSAFFMFTKALPILSLGASVIFTCSVAHDRGRPGDPLYSASKAAVRSLVRTLAADPLVLARKIRVNTVSPGAVLTPLTRQPTPEATQQVNAYIQSVVPMGRWGQPEEIARAVLFLASADSSYMTGAEIAVDGGLAQI